MSELKCTNCELNMNNDPGAAGKRCPRCENGAITWED